MLLDVSGALGQVAAKSGANDLVIAQEREAKVFIAVAENAGVFSQFWLYVKGQEVFHRPFKGL